MPGHRLDVTWTDGTHSLLDMSGELVAGGGVFTALIDAAAFQTVRVGERARTIEWRLAPVDDAAKTLIDIDAELKALNTANPTDSTLPKSPYVGVQFAAIPEFQAIGVAVGQQMSAALSGKASIDQALSTSQNAADREMRKAGYYK